MKKRLLSALLTFCMVLTLLPVSAFATGDTSPDQSVETAENSPVQITKEVTDNKGGTYEIEMEAYVTGQVISGSSKPLDIVLVLDQSGSMADPFSTSTGYQYKQSSHENWWNYYNNDRLWYETGGNYYRVKVEQKATYSYIEITDNWTNNASRRDNDYWSHKEELYQRVNGAYVQVAVEREWVSTGAFHGYYQYTYTLSDGTTVTSNGNNGVPEFEPNLY